MHYMFCKPPSVPLCFWLSWAVNAGAVVSDVLTQAEYRRDARAPWRSLALAHQQGAVCQTGGLVRAPHTQGLHLLTRYVNANLRCNTGVPWTTTQGCQSISVQFQEEIIFIFFFPWSWNTLPWCATTLKVYSDTPVHLLDSLIVFMLKIHHHSVQYYPRQSNVNMSNVSVTGHFVLWSRMASVSSSHTGPSAERT